ncbi:MAG: N-acetylmuramoyl-L-alanine amidase [Lachnospiraceae bacterium]|nr:N-acetylmuramoyl-L-alanine amidase [Lachnospiraceae bacterium]
MTGIYSRIIRLVTVLAAAIAIGGALLIYMFQGSPELSRRRVIENSGSLISYIRKEQKKLSAYDRLHELELHIPRGHRASEFTIEESGTFTVYTIHIPDINASYFADFPVTGNGRNISDMTYNISASGGTVSIVTSQPLFLKKTSDGQRVFFDFISPRQYFDKIVVIDPGHGGRDQGASAGGDCEKDITLSVVKKMKQITGISACRELKDYSDQISAVNVSGVGRVGFFYTRLSDRKVFLKERGAFARALKPDLFLSVHVNSTASGRISYINGASVLYRAGDKTGESKRFAGIVEKGLLKDLGAKSKGTIAGDELYLIRTAQWPVALAELGFITNPSEHRKLVSQSYQKKAAESMIRAVEEYLGPKACR